MTLATVDLPGVELLAAGHFHGRGSPPEGDRVGVGDLAAIAAANTALAGELRVPLKLGHSDGQRLIKNSGLAADEMPAAGWVENFRVAGSKLVADFRGVPRKLADLIAAGAFRSRSVEMRPVASQRTKQMFEMAVTGVALLGEHLPAVRTLDDIAAFYSDGEPTLRTVVVMPDGREVSTEQALREGAHVPSEAASESAYLDYARATGVLSFIDDPAARGSWQGEGLAEPGLRAAAREARAGRGRGARSGRAGVWRSARIRRLTGVRCELLRLEEGNPPVTT